MYSGRQGDEELISWSFKAALREQSDYDEYPLGRQQIWILLWHPDFQHNVYLEPDLESYTTLDPTALPGLDKDVVLENWELQRSFFSFRDNRYNTAFGVQGYAPQEKQPELYFNVSIQTAPLGRCCLAGDSTAGDPHPALRPRDGDGHKPGAAG